MASIAMLNNQRVQVIFCLLGALHLVAIFVALLRGPNMSIRLIPCHWLSQVVHMFFFFAHYFEIFKSAYHLSQDEAVLLGALGIDFCMNSLAWAPVSIKIPQIRCFIRDSPKRFVICRAQSTRESHSAHGFCIMGRDATGCGGRHFSWTQKNFHGYNVYIVGYCRASHTGDAPWVVGVAQNGRPLVVVVVCRCCCCCCCNT